MNGYQAYGALHQKTLSGRALEAEAFFKAARLLKQVAKEPHNKRLLQEALINTQKLWLVVQADVSSNPKHLDDETRSHLLSLSLFVDRKCTELAKRLDAKKLQALIEVNENIASGLI